MPFARTGHDLDEQSDAKRRDIPFLNVLTPSSAKGGVPRVATPVLDEKIITISNRNTPVPRSTECAMPRLYIHQ